MARAARCVDFGSGATYIWGGQSSEWSAADEFSLSRSSCTSFAIFHTFPKNSFRAPDGTHGYAQPCSRPPSPEPYSPGPGLYIWTRVRSQASFFIMSPRPGLTDAPRLRGARKVAVHTPLWRGGGATYRGTPQAAVGTWWLVACKMGPCGPFRLHKRAHLGEMTRLAAADPSDEFSERSVVSPK